MIKLSEFQEQLFHMRQATVTSATDKTDQYIDDEQAEEFYNSARVILSQEYDDAYPFSIVDHIVLTSDLVMIGNRYNCIFCPLSSKRYLSRHDISFTDYTDKKFPPQVLYSSVHIREPIHGQEVDAVTWSHHNHERRIYEKFHKSVTTGEEDIDQGYVYNGRAVIIKGCIAVWSGPTYGPCCKEGQIPPEPVPIQDPPQCCY